MQKVMLLAILGIAGSAVIAFADPQNPSSPSSPPSPPPVSAQPPDTHTALICQDRVITGSRLAYARDCHTEAEWEVIRRGGRDYLNTIRRRSLESNQMPGGSGH